MPLLKKPRIALTLLVLALAAGVALKLTASLPVTRAVAVHPFLITTADRYAELQNRALQSPWLEMKTKAITDASTLTYNSSESVPSKANDLRDIVSAASLSYILDEPNRAVYKDKIYTTLLNWDNLYAGLDCSQWNNTVPPGYAFFNSVLALDIIHNDLTPTQISTVETKLSRVGEWYWSHNCAWEENQYGARGIWALYTGNRTRIDSAKAAYRTALLGELTTSNVFKQGPNYAFGRLAVANDAKGYFMDVLQFTGEDQYYSDSKFQGFFEWLYSGSISPSKQFLIFGDTPPGVPGGNYQYTANFRAHKFSAQAADNASWLVDPADPAGRLLTYVLMDQPLPPPVKPKSAIWSDGGATFWENNPSPDSLQVALWNPKSSDDHSHKDINAIHLSAFGENLLRNTGYDVWGGSCAGYSWSYIHDQAFGNNVVLLNGRDHSSKNGGGITQGFTGAVFDYASGSSGAAVAGHQRNVAFVHPQDGAPGYVVLFDEVSGLSKTSTVNVALHPDSNLYAALSPNQEYEWTVNRYTGQNAKISLFLGTTPDSAVIKDGGLCERVVWGGQSRVGKYLYSTYKPASGSAVKNIVTVLFPSNSTVAKSAMARVSAPGITGATIAHPSATDYALESSGAASVSYQGISFQGTAALYRKDSSGGVPFYFVRKGKSFSDNNSPATGFSAATSVGIYMKGTSGNIVSPGTDVTFSQPNVTGINLNGSPATITGTGPNWVKVTVPAGTYTVDLVAP